MVMKYLFIVFYVGFLFYCVIRLLSKPFFLWLSKRLIHKFERQFILEYNKYKEYIQNELTLDLSTPAELNTSLYCDSFRTNAELRHSMMQLAYSIRDLESFNDLPYNEQVEDIFRNIRKIAYSCNEPICKIHFIKIF